MVKTKIILSPHLFFSIRHWFSVARGAVNMGQRHPYKTKAVYHLPLSNTIPYQGWLWSGVFFFHPYPFLEASNLTQTQTYRYLHGWGITTQPIRTLPWVKYSEPAEGITTFNKTTQNGECRGAAVPGRLKASVGEWYPHMHKDVEIFPRVTPNKETCLHAEATSDWFCCSRDSSDTDFIKAQFRRNRNPSKNKTELNSLFSWGWQGLTGWFCHQLCTQSYRKCQNFTHFLQVTVVAGNS